jgi:hypothetical protein
MNDPSSDTASVSALVEPLLELSVQTRAVCSIAAAPPGERLVFDVVAGSFEGAALRGRVLPGGGDWLTRTAAGSQLDVRLVLETDDGVKILLRYGGRASRRGDEPRVEIAGSFEAPQGRYEWLNSIQAFGLGSPTADGVRYQLYRFK